MAAILLAVSTACQRPVAVNPLDAGADRYVQLLAALGARDPDSIDSEGTLSPGPAIDSALSLAAIADEATRLMASLRANEGATDVSLAFRQQHLLDQLDALAARADQLRGRVLTPTAEWRRLLGQATPAAVRSLGASAHAREVLTELARLVPGRASLTDRVEAFDHTFTVETERLPQVFERAMHECRARTLAQVALPSGESVTIGYVTGRPWSGFSRYLGNGRSQIDVNVGFPLTVDRVLELACHEGYPGHHVHNTLRDQRLVQERGWREFSVMPLFSPESFSSEAAASLATQMVFSDAERLAFERDVLFPLGGLGPAGAERYLRVARLREQLEGEIAAIVSGYLTGELDLMEATWALEERAVMGHPLSTLQFVNKYRGLSLAYTLGKARLSPDLGTAAPVEARWKHLLGLIDAGDSSRRARESRNAG